MRWGNPPIAINFSFEVVRMFVPVRIGAPLVGSSGLLEFALTGAVGFMPDTLTMLKRLAPRR